MKKERAKELFDAFGSDLRIDSTTANIILSVESDAVRAELVVAALVGVRGRGLKMLCQWSDPEIVRNKAWDMARGQFYDYKNAPKAPEDMGGNKIPATKPSQDGEDPAAESSDPVKNNESSEDKQTHASKEQDEQKQEPPASQTQGADTQPEPEQGSNKTDPPAEESTAGQGQEHQPPAEKKPSAPSESQNVSESDTKTQNGNKSPSENVSVSDTKDQQAEQGKPGGSGAPDAFSNYYLPGANNPAMGRASAGPDRPEEKRGFFNRLKKKKPEYDPSEDYTQLIEYLSVGEFDEDHCSFIIQCFKEGYRTDEIKMFALPGTSLDLMLKLKAAYIARIAR